MNTKLPKINNESVISELHQIADEVENFLVECCDELFTSIDHAQQLIARVAEHQPTSVTLDDEKAAWRKQRSMQEDELKRKFDLLSEAWLRLEEEQREFLMNKEKLSYAPTSLASTQDARPDDPVSATAVEQFQKLREEMNRSRPRFSSKTII